MGIFEVYNHLSDHLISLPCTVINWCTASVCARGDLDWILGRISSLRGFSST